MFCNVLYALCVSCNVLHALCFCPSLPWLVGVLLACVGVAVLKFDHELFLLQTPSLARERERPFRSPPAAAREPLAAPTARRTPLPMSVSHPLSHPMTHLVMCASCTRGIFAVSLHDVMRYCHHAFFDPSLSTCSKRLIELLSPHTLRAKEWMASFIVFELQQKGICLKGLIVA